MKRFVISIILIVIVILLNVFFKDFYKLVKKSILRVNNYVKVFHQYTGIKEETQEVGFFLEKEKYEDGYLVLNTNEVVALSSGTVVFRGIMDDRKTILVMSDCATYKYQNIDDYKCLLFQSVNVGDVIASNRGATYYEIED